MGRFDSLSDLDFEELVADVLRADTGLPFRAGTRGRDQGIDVLAVAKRRRHVGQCKHLRTGDIRLLIREAKREAQTLARRKPRWASYRFITSMRLSHARRDELAAILSPWISTPEDVLGENDLGRLLRKHPNVEARHVKLWLPSVGALRRTLHSGAYERSAALLEDTRDALSRYVQTETFHEARSILHQHGVLVVAGPPGVGKTTLARLLMLDGLEQDYEPYDIPQGGLLEAWDLMVADQKQLFFYDDFLGRISLVPGQEDDEVLMRFMRRVSRSKTTRIVLTTREYVLRQAQRFSDVLERHTSELHRYFLYVDRFDRREKARIFYNHIYFSDQVDNDARKALLENRAYRWIIDHPNYSPRLIEWMTGLAGEGLDANARANYPAYCLEILNNPDRLWERAFDIGLEEPDRVLLLCLVSLPEPVSIEVLEKAFRTACGVRGISLHGRRFLTSLKVLDDSFVSTHRFDRSTVVAPQNPSLIDFLTAYLRSSRADAEPVIAGAKYLEQVLWAWRVLSPAAARGGRGAPPADLMPAFSSAFDATLDSPPLRGAWSISERAAGVRPPGSDFERLQMILDYLDTSRELSDLVTRDWLGKHARAWVRRSLTDVPTTQGLRLVRRLAEHGALDSTGVITEIKPNLLGLSSRANRWPLIAEAHDVAPAAFSDSEWSSLRNEIAKDLEEMLTDAAGYFEEVSELEDFANAAEQMGVDVEGEIYATAFEEVEIAVAEREGEEESRDDPDYDGEEFREIRGGGNEDADIDAMFDRLLD